MNVDERSTEVSRIMLPIARLLEAIRKQVRYVAGHATLNHMPKRQDAILSGYRDLAAGRVLESSGDFKSDMALQWAEAAGKVTDAAINARLLEDRRQ